jgi:outer membrane receptor protein involved in Fe transport
MPNPPAKYDASGNSGVINIITKRSKLKGFSGNVSANYGQGKYAKTNDNLNLNFNSKKISLYTTVNFVDAENYHDLTLIRRFKNPDSTPKSSFTQILIENTSKILQHKIRFGLLHY